MSKHRLAEAHERFVESFAKAHWPVFRGGMDSCQSPIEIMLYFALLQSTAINDFGTVLEIEPQAEIEGYHVDFLVELLSTDIDARSRVLVECDGHDFHERTKEQASRDKKRDRELQKAGYKVFRFSGSDIWKDVFGCAQEVYDHLRNTLPEVTPV